MLTEMKKLFFFKLIFDFLFVNSLLAQTNMNDSSSVFTIVEEMPAFKGGEEALFRFLASSVIYPLNAKEKNIQGTVYVTFTVNTKDSLTDIKVIKGVCSDIDFKGNSCNNIIKWPLESWKSKWKGCERKYDASNKVCVGLRLWRQCVFKH